MYENMNNKIARSIKIFGNIIGVCGVIAGFYTLIIGGESIYDGVGVGAVFITGINAALDYIVVMFIFWGLAEIIELLSVIKANTTNQVEIFCQKNSNSYSNNNNSGTDASDGL